MSLKICCQIIMEGNNMLKIKKAKGADTKPDTELWLEEIDERVDLNMKLTNSPVVSTILSITKGGLYITSHIPKDISLQCDFETKENERYRDYHSIKLRGEL